jgi:multidrug efflux pump subunit AcrB
VSVVEGYLRRPHLILSVVLLLSAIGLIGFFRIPVTLFPDSERPQVAVVTVWPGASSDDVAADLSRVIEKEFSTLEQVRRVTSTSNDEASVVTAEFRYAKGLDSAATDVANALGKIRPQLPADIKPFQIYKVSSATPAVLTIAVSPKPGSGLDLAMVRRIADNPIKEELLRVPEVANVEVFGGWQTVLRVDLDPDKLQAFRLSAGQVAQALASWNRNTPEGLVVTDRTHILLKSEGALERPEELGAVVVASTAGQPVYLRDIATIAPSVQERLSVYHGNGKPAVGINIQRAHFGHAMPTINAVLARLPRLEARYPGLSFEIADTQGELITKSVGNMKEALRDAILMTILVIFLFLADVRGTLLAAISIPFTYLITFGFMWLFGFEFNMMTLTGVILGVGMLLDDAIVVLENIERHYHKLGKDLNEAVIGGTQEVMVAVLSGTYGTVAVLVPIIWIGGFVQTVLRPLSLTLSIALVASYVVSVTVLPILAPIFLRFKGGTRGRWELAIDRVVSGGILRRVESFFAATAAFAVGHKLLFLVPALLMLVVSGQLLMPLVGRDLMPPMDTGIFRVTFETYPNTSVKESEAILASIEEMIRREKSVVRMSATLGSEPGVLSFGSGRNPQQAFITVHIVDRFSRRDSMWQVEDRILDEMRRVPGLRFPAVYDYGATPLSTVRATVDLMITGPDPKVLDSIARDVDKRLQSVGGLRSTVRTWTYDRVEYRFIPDAEQLALYGVDAAAVATQVSAQVKGVPASPFRVPHQDSFAIWVQVTPSRRDAPVALGSLPIVTPKGSVPLSALGRVEQATVPTLHTRQALGESVDVLGYRSTAAVTHVNANVQKALAGLRLPPGYVIVEEGEQKSMDESFSALLKALLLALVLLYFSLVPAFRSFLHPLTIMVAIPLGMIGTTWAMLLAGKHSSMPSFMGMILLAGIVVKNSILLIDFIEEARAHGMPVREALEQSVRVRTRPILMTAFSTVVGMLPIALEWAIGLERLSPLAVVAIGGLLVSTFLTLIYVPLIYDLFEAGRMRIGALLTRPPAIGEEGT